MKNKSKIIFLISLLLVFASLTVADEITIVADEWAPYNGEPDSSEQGYGIEIAKHIFKVAGHTVIYKVIPWSRAIKSTRYGKYNAIIGTTKNEVPDFIFPEEEFGISANSFFVKKGGPWEAWEFKGVESLLTVKIGLIKDYSYGVILDNFFKTNKNIIEYIHGEDPLLLNIKKLLIGRFDVIIEDANVFLQKAMQMGVSNQIIKAKSKKDTEDNRIYIAFAPKNTKSKEYAEIFTRGIKNLRISGELGKIIAKYGLEDWK